MTLPGKRIIVTQPAYQALQQIELFKSLGAEVTHKPMIALQPARDYAEFDKYLRKPDDFDWIIFTSANGVQAFDSRLKMLGMHTDQFKTVRCGTIGAATTTALSEAGFETDFEAGITTAAGFLHEFTQKIQEISGMKFLLPMGNIARGTLPDGLSKRGAEITRITVYETTSVAYPADEITGLFRSGRIDMVTFMSSSAVDAIMRFITETERTAVISKMNVASIGPVTTKTLRSYGIDPVVESPVQSVSSLVNATIEHFQKI